MYRVSDLNEVTLSGYFDGEFWFDHVSKGREMYVNYFKVRRNNGVEDRLLVRITGDLLSRIPEKDILTKKFCLYGNLNSAESNPKETLNMRIRNLWTVEERADRNSVTVSGIMFDIGELYSTSSGRAVRKIKVVSTNRYGKRIKIPVVAWGEYAVNITKNDVGTAVVVDGRLQSRQIYHYDNNGEKIVKMHYEVMAQNVRAI